MKQGLLIRSMLLAMLIAGCNPAVISQTTKPTNSLETSLTATFTPGAAIATSTSTPAYYTIATAIVKTVVFSTQPKVYASYLSPNKKWRADIIIYDCVPVQAGAGPNAYEQLKLLQVSEGSVSIVDSQLQNCGGVGAYGLGGLFWSPSSQYFYYTDARESVPDGLCGYWPHPIKRVNVFTKKTESVGGGPLSPDKTKLALWQDNEIVIWSLDEGEIARIQSLIPDAFKGEIAWSPDSQSLVYLQTQLDCFPFGNSYVTRLDLSGLTQNLLLESESRGFGKLVWDTPDQISLVDDKGDRWRYNLISKELKPVR